MRERRQIVGLWKRGDAVALVTLVGVEGSSYRKPGARLLIAENGDYAGSISGGCLEAEVIRKARWLLRDGACMQRYSTLFDDTAEMPYGLGCGGVVDVLLEPAGTPEFDALMRAMEDSLGDQSFSVMTSLPEHGGKFHRVVNAVEDESGDVVSIASTAKLSAHIFREKLAPPQRLIILGAGDDAQPLVQMASLLGWNVVVADGRMQWARTERFPEAGEVLVAPSKKQLRVTERDVAVVMTHSYEQDREWLRLLLPLQPRYLGLLGARHRSALLASEVAGMLDWPLEQVCERMFAPVGLDLGGDGAEAIALAILAEMLACIEGKLGTSRRMTAEIIQEQIAQGGASRYLQAQCAL